MADGPPKIWVRVRLTFCLVAGWLANCSCLASHLTKYQLCTNVKDGHPLKIRFRVSLTFCQMACWLANCSWLASHLTKCHLYIDVKDGDFPLRSKYGLGWHFFRCLVGWPIAAGWLTDWSSNKLSTIFCMKGLCEARAKTHTVVITQMNFLNLGRWTLSYLMYRQVDILSDGLFAGQLQLAAWLVGHLTKCYLYIDVKEGHPIKIWFRVRLTFVRWFVG